MLSTKKKKDPFDCPVSLPFLLSVLWKVGIHFHFDDSGITYNPTLFSFNVKPFYAVFTKCAPPFDDGDQHVPFCVVVSSRTHWRRFRRFWSFWKRISIESTPLFNSDGRLRVLSSPSLLPNTHPRKPVLPDLRFHLVHPITIPECGLLSNLIICTRCGSRRQIRNTPFFSLSIPIVNTPWWRMDASCRQTFKSLFRLFDIQYSCDNPVHPTLLDCLREFTASDEVDGVSCQGFSCLFCLTGSCGLLNALLVQKQDQNPELVNELSRSLHKVRSSHDLEEDVLSEVKEGKGTIYKYELIGRPPRSLLLHLQRKYSAYAS